MRKPLREGDARAIRTVDKAFTTLAGSDAAAPLEAIADGTGLPQSTAARLLRTMCIRGVVQLDDTAHGYRLGWELVCLGRAAHGQLGLGREIQPYLALLARNTGGTASPAVPDRGVAERIAQIPGGGTVRAVSRIGHKLELHCTALGKAVMVGLSEEELARHIGKRGLRSLTANTIVDPEQLRMELARVRESGFSVDNEETEMGVRYMAARPLDPTRV